MKAAIVAQRRALRERLTSEVLRQNLPPVPTPIQLRDQAKRIAAAALARKTGAR